MHPDDLAAARASLQDRILELRNEQGFWEGELSSSALSTATALTALSVCDRKKHHALINGGIQWLADDVNPDGGWGDTPCSQSNLSTTTLVWAAFAAARTDEQYPDTIAACESWLSKKLGAPLSPDTLARAIISAYGKDKTFSVPILTMTALSGRLGEGKAAWKHVIPLPFELAALPHQFYKAVRLPVVSYALPALIAIGQVHYKQTGSRNLLRKLTYQPCLKKLETLQPENGGFLEAAPLTSFVLMSLAAAGQKDHIVSQRAIAFLESNVRPDGSWPIDTNLATWVTTLAINALPTLENPTPTLNWLLDQQYTEEHPYTHAAPGGWAWTDLPGGVPDADDTPGALLALHKLAPEDPRVIEAATNGIRWLIDLQNRDGGFPTFCRGWGTLPFDKSCCDLTGHVLRAFAVWQPHLPVALQTNMKRATDRALAYLLNQQRPDGSWIPLWFGNELQRNKENPTFGTARVLKALVLFDVAPAVIDRGTQWLFEHQRPDGGWGADKDVASSIEETALAVEVLPDNAARDNGIHYLITHLDDPPAPIGLYFAQLWYYEKMYPLVFSLSALETAGDKNIGATKA